MNTSYFAENEFQLLETATFLNGLPPNIFGLEDWSEADVLTKVLAASQEEYLFSLKHKQSKDSSNSENRNSDNQYHSHKQTNSPLNSTEKNASSASTLTKSHDNDNNYGVTTDEDKFLLTDSQIPQQDVNSSNAAPISVLSSVPIQINSEIVQNEDDAIGVSPDYLTEDLLSSDKCTEEPILHIVPNEYSESSGVNSQECSETVSRTNSPEESLVKDDPI